MVQAWTNIKIKEPMELKTFMKRREGMLLGNQFAEASVQYETTHIVSYCTEIDSNRLKTAEVSSREGNTSRLSWLFESKSMTRSSGLIERVVTQLRLTLCSQDSLKWTVQIGYCIHNMHKTHFNMCTMNNCLKIDTNVLVKLQFLVLDTFKSKNDQ